MDAVLKQVEVVLKKTKITKSILNQSLNISYRDLKDNEIIGWCLDGKTKVVVSFNSELYTIVKSTFLRSFNVVEINSDNLKPVLEELGYDRDDLYYLYNDEDFFNKHELLGTFIVNVYSETECRKTYLKTNSEVQEFIDFIKEYQVKVETKGQFYL